MRAIVCGGRSYQNKEVVYSTLDYFKKEHGLSVLIHGGATGADDLAKQWATKNGIMIVCYPANWTKHGRSAGPIRNQLMLDDGKPDAVIAFPGYRGTKDMIKKAITAGIKCYKITDKEQPASVLPKDVSSGPLDPFQ